MIRKSISRQIKSKIEEKGMISEQKAFKEQCSIKTLEYILDKEDP